ncbi:hypothetical protein SAMN05421636_10714 [Pricia antarctica]|uniref:Uncharacterized protein n=2 Tax=Pricia antarctica TaxID=641691 RepID=A0A1G7F988_9FLAO|nr:hypothetical protein SAMN05421636_10714 [Pricia antarctica]
MVSDDSGAYGHPNIHTPNIDKMARFGHDCNMPFNSDNDATVGTPTPIKTCTRMSRLYIDA